MAAGHDRLGVDKFNFHKKNVPELHKTIVLNGYDNGESVYVYVIMIKSGFDHQICVYAARLMHETETRDSETTVTWTRGREIRCQSKSFYPTFIPKELPLLNHNGFILTIHA
jgi:hypothetical protein